MLVAAPWSSQDTSRLCVWLSTHRAGGADEPFEALFDPKAPAESTLLRKSRSTVITTGLGPDVAYPSAFEVASSERPAALVARTTAVNLEAVPALSGSGSSGSGSSGTLTLISHVQLLNQMGRIGGERSRSNSMKKFSEGFGWQVLCSNTA